ncbi:MAG: hypothetical protein ACOC70_00140 [bacterium]
MERKREAKQEGPGRLRRRLARAVSPDPLLRVATFLLASGLVGSMLVLASSIVCLQRSDDSHLLPVRIDFREMEERRKRDIFADISEFIGEQEMDEDPEDEKAEVEQLKDRQVVEDPPAKVVNEQEKPVGPAETDEDSKELAAISVKGGEGGARALYSNRGGADKKTALGKYGGGEDTENAVARGLDWFARHQDADGKWSHTRFTRHCKPNAPKCSPGIFDQPALHLVRIDPGLTGLALLCFAGSGHTHLRDGPYQENARRAADWLCGQQAKSGLIGDYPRKVNYYMMYNHGIATLALGELYAMTGDPKLRPHLEKAVQFIARAQQPSGAWDYTDVKSGRYDTSVTGWQVMALKAAHSGGIQIPAYTLYTTADFMERVTLPDGQVYYANKYPSARSRGHGMAAVGLTAQQFLGFPNDRRMARRQVHILLRHPPDWSRLNLRNRSDSVYYWYYATLALFQTGGEVWDRWNPKMKKALLAHQRRDGCADGSWDAPNTQWARTGGRLYVTALNVLSLEVYYRYLPLYSGATLDTVGALIQTIEHGKLDEAAKAVRLLGKFKGDRAREYLVAMANSDDHKLALEASVALAEQRDLAAVVPLLRQLRSQEPHVRFQALGAMAPLMDRGLAPYFIKCLRDESSLVSRRAARVLRQYARVSFGFEPEASRAQRERAIKKWNQWWEKHQKGERMESSRPWLVIGVYPEKKAVAFSTDKPRQAAVGEELIVRRDEEYVARVRVTLTENELCVATVLEQIEPDAIRKGDVVTPRD